MPGAGGGTLPWANGCERPRAWLHGTCAMRLARYTQGRVGCTSGCQDRMGLASHISVPQSQHPSFQHVPPACRRASSRWSIVVVMGEVPSPASQLIDSVARPVSLEVDTEGSDHDPGGSLGC